MSADPDLVYFGGSARTKGGQLARDLVSAESEAILLVSDGCRTKAFLDAAGATSLEGRCFATSAGLSPQQSDCSEIMFLKRYQQKYGTCPSNAAIHGYEAARLAIRAIADVGRKDRRAIVESAFASRVDDGVLGAWSIDENGDTTLQEVSVSVVRNGTFEHEEVVPVAPLADWIRDASVRYASLSQDAADLTSIFHMVSVRLIKIQAVLFVKMR